jgi:hypothetical protein
MKTHSLTLAAAVSAALLTNLAASSSASAQAACYNFEGDSLGDEGSPFAATEGPIWAPTARWTFINENEPTTCEPLGACTIQPPFEIANDPTGDRSLRPWSDYSGPGGPAVNVVGTFQVDGALPTHVKLDIYVTIPTTVTAYRTDMSVIQSFVVTAGEYQLEFMDDFGAAIAYIDITSGGTEVWIQGVCVE